jgi:hypothetical protein
MSHEILTVPLENLRINGGTQPRAELNEAAVADYAESIRFAVSLPPVTVFFDGSEFWLADGFHRYHAHRAGGAMEIQAEVHEGTRRDAILYSVGANASHGLRRSNDDKRRAVMTLLNDAEWSTWSANEIAQRCGVSHTFVNGIKSSLETVSSEKPAETAYTTKHGTQAVMKTANIGKAKPAVQHTPEGESGMPAAPVAQKTPLAVVPAPAPAAAPAPAPAATVEIPTDELTALRTENDELRASLKETLADNEMMGRVFDADDKLKAAMDEAKRQKAIATNAERTLAAKNGEYIARAAQITHWKNRAEKAEKALAKVAA